jgi:RimJ/RimL family protein N-acetyltransferase
MGPRISGAGARGKSVVTLSMTAIHQITLPDGTVVPLRQIAPEDAPALHRFHHDLSADSIYLRHFHSLPDLTSSQEAYFTGVDGTYRHALIALDPAAPSEIIAVVRYEGAPGNDLAEYAALVTDRWQGRGLGTALTRELIEAARRNGIRAFSASVLPQNLRMLNLFRDLQLSESIRYIDGVAEVEIDISAPEH